MGLRKLFPYLKKYRDKITLGFFFVGISDLFYIVVPKFVGKAIDIISTKHFSQEDILSQILLIVAFTLFGGIFLYLARRTIITVSRLVEYDLRRDFLASITFRSYNFFTERTTGELMAFAINDISAAREFIGPAVMYGANTITTFIFALYFMFSLDYKLTLLSILPLPFITITTYLIGKKIHTLFKEVQKHFSVLSTQAQEVFSGIRLVKAYVQEIFEAQKFQKLAEEYRQKNMKVEFYNSLIMPLLLILIGSSQLIVLGYGGYRVIQGTMTIGIVSQFFIYINILIWPVAALGWVTNLTQRASASINRLWEILGEGKFDFKTVNRDLIKKEFIISGNIKFSNIWFRYDDSSDFLLKNVSFEIKAGQTLGIVGKVGSGKSTIVKLLSKVILPTQGKIYIDGIDIEQIPDDFFYSFIAVVPQEPFLFSTTIAENISLNGNELDMDEIEYFAKIAGLEQDIKIFPEGIRTVVGERGITLSGGQRQRVSIARALFAKPKVLILDDAFSAVDIQTEKQILKNIYSNFSNLTVFIISNRISSLIHSNKIIVIDKGTVVEEGTHSTLLTLGGKYCALYELQKLDEEFEKG